MALELTGNGPLSLRLDVIDEDPNQPRKHDNPGFSVESLEELAITIRDRGVKSPISVREHPNCPGRYIINHGARRYRASKIAGKDTIPAFIDSDFTETDQVVENLQRNELTAREIADFLGRELAKGRLKSQIAKGIGMSPAFVTQHLALLDLPPPIATAFNNSRTKDVTIINELVSAYKRNPNEVSSWLEDERNELTRGTIKLLRASLERGNKARHHRTTTVEQDKLVRNGEQITPDSALDIAFNKISSLKKELESIGVECSFFLRGQSNSKGPVIHLLVGEGLSDVEQEKQIYMQGCRKT